MENLMVVALEAKAIERDKPILIKCPNKECGHLNQKNRLTCVECGGRLFENHKSAEGKTSTKKAKKILAKREKGIRKEKVKEEPKPKVKTKVAPAIKKEKAEKEYPVKGSIRDKCLKAIQRHSEGITMGGIQKELKIIYRLDGYPKEFEERKLIKSKMEKGERIYLPL